MKLECKDVKPRLSAFQDNELDEVSKARIAAHIKECEGCRLELKRMVQAVERMAQLPEVEPTDNFTALVMGRVKTRKKLRWLALPSLVYSLIFILFFIVGWWLQTTLKKPAPLMPKEELMAQVFYQSQNLSLSAVQDISLKKILAEK